MYPFNKELYQLKTNFNQKLNKFGISQWFNFKLEKLFFVLNKITYRQIYLGFK